LRKNQKGSKETKGKGTKEDSYKVEENTSPEKLGACENFKERHGGWGDRFLDTKFFQFYFLEICIRK
jgi:hypothetical protein